MPEPPTGLDGWPLLRASQSAALTIPNTGEVVTIDAGGLLIHPTDKKPIGERLALSARHLAYGEDVVSSGPRYKDNIQNGNKVSVAFSNHAEGLVGGEHGEVDGFAIAGADTHFVWADAFIDGDSVSVFSEEIEKPVFLRYAWTRNPANANLYNAVGLPATPFEAKVNESFSIGYFQADQTNIEQGQSTTLSWKVYGATTITLGRIDK